MNYNDSWENAGGYGFWCGKKCAERKQSAGIAPKFGKGNKEEFAKQQAIQQAAIQQQQLAAIQGASSDGGSKTGIILAGVLGLAVVGGLLFFAMKKK